MSTNKAGDIGEENVREVLRGLKGNLISGFIRSNNIIYYGKNFQLDFLAFVPKIGLVVIEVKNWKGTVKATSKDKWVQEVGQYRNEYGNASNQVLRTSGLLLQILEKAKMNKWPIRPVVVFANDKAKILKAKEPLAPQTDIIFKSMLGKWIEENSLDEVFYSFTDMEFSYVTEAIKKYSQEYCD
ncbi:nuclease-related domain-containing protein [Psychromonas sp.]|uniref:nuclease-related domain-containing protein n=1 Tax=Psychromonas sp. TaxID=1884585 RepID=UPI0035655D23